MVLLRLLTLFVSLMIATACSTVYKTSSAPIPATKEHVDIRIGMIADTQLTTDYQADNYVFRGKYADKFKNVAIRTTAQEYLADDHLTYMLKALAQQSPDIIVYLGDAANSGCKDEIDTFMKIISEFRDKSNIPTFLVVGNHDYLATGNQTASDTREAVCGNDDFYTKESLIKVYSAFNRDSSKLPVPNASYAITNFFDVFDKGVTPFWQCNTARPEQQHVEQCFYAGVVSLASANHSFDLVLADSSDYSNVKILPQLWNDLQVYGMRGAIGFYKQGQSDWIKGRLNAADSLRFIATHYPMEHLGYKLPWAGKGRPSDFFTANGYNVWLSAHSHNPHMNPVGNALTYDGDNKSAGHQLNVGSTTDYRPRAAVARMVNGRFVMEFVESMTAPDVLACRKRLHDQYGDDIERTLGLTQAYRTKGYSTLESRLAIDAFLARNNGAEEYWMRCLMNIAAINEYENKGR